MNNRLTYFIVVLALAALTRCSADPKAPGRAAETADRASAAPAPARPSPDDVATAMVDRALPTDWVGGFENLGQLSAEPNKDLSKQLLAALPASKSPSLQEVLSQFRYPAYMRELYTDGKLRTDRLRQYIGRLKNLKPPDLAAFVDAHKLAVGDTPPDWLAAMAVIQADAFWAEERLTEAFQTRCATRLSGIPKSALDEWPPAAAEKIERVVYLLDTEPLWTEDKFDEELYRAALPLARERYKERSREQTKARSAKPTNST